MVHARDGFDSPLARRRSEPGDETGRAGTVFAAGACDALRRPVHAILGALERLARMAPTHRQQQELDMAEQSGRELLGVLDDLLAIESVPGVDGGALADFTQSCKTELRALQAAYDAQDLCTFMELAYGICQASRAAGAVRLAAACESIEYGGRAQLAAIDAGCASGDALGQFMREAYQCFLREFGALQGSPRRHAPV